MSTPTATARPAASGRRALVFHPLTVAAVEPEGTDSVVVTFEVPPQETETFAFRPGQHITVRRPGAGTGDVRRSYSLCGPANALRIGVRTVAGGSVSTWLANEVAPGDQVEVLPPLGGFLLSPPTGTHRRLTFVAAGSGITPILAMVTAVLDDDPHADVALLVLNRTMADAMFVEDLQALKSRHMGRFTLLFCCTREQRETDPLGRRPMREDLWRFRENGVLPDADEWYLCGPASLLDDLDDVLRQTGVDPERVHRELFGVAAVTGAAPAAVPGQQRGTQATVTFLGRSTPVVVAPGSTLLAAARAVRGDLPYSCEAGVCSTCRALVRAGEVSGPECPGITAAERADGFVLTCQAQAASDVLELDFDV